MEEEGENEAQRPPARRAKQTMPRIGDAAQRCRRALRPFAAPHVPFIVSLSRGDTPPPPSTMSRLRHPLHVLLALTVLPAALGGCSIVGPIILNEGCEELAESYGIECPDFAVRNLDAVSLAGILLSGARGASVTDNPAVVAAWERGSLPLAFTLNLGVQNPGERALTIERLAWTLTIDGEEAASGSSSAPVTVAPGGSATVPLRVGTDLREVFNERTRAALVQFAEDLADEQEETVPVRLSVVPTVRSAGGESVTFPEPFVVDYRVGAE